ncbi:MAG: 16S rRNA (guanine(966)-N(2))-methyltransferase RsmD [Deltaproteobacteria bacterium]|nr:MAG: 16S rRNA (guanine(966)-N(2))-methyltransferase RsmD [Deltaproteobacteria bacterium]
MIRITGGEYKGRLIKIPKNQKVRPTRSMVRQAIFNMIGNRIFDAVVLDLFSGSGLLGLEAKSRGARQVFFVENDKMVCKVLKNNLAAVTQRFRDPILCTTAQKALRQFHQAGVSFDIVLMDPPYQMNVGPVLKSLSSTGIVKAGGWIVLERGKTTELTIPEGLVEIKEKTYGYSKIYIFSPFNPSTESEA